MTVFGFWAPVPIAWVIVTSGPTALAVNRELAFRHVAKLAAVTTGSTVFTAKVGFVTSPLVVVVA